MPDTGCAMDGHSSLRTGVLVAPFGSITLRATDDELVGIDLSLDRCAPSERYSGTLLCEVARQLRAYFEQRHFVFSLPLKLDGTPYQQSVWRVLRDIPPGSTATYAGLAAGLHSGARAVAAACRANPLPLVIPCHRVVAANGLGGYCGAARGPWLDVKRWLLDHEVA